MYALKQQNVSIIGAQQKALKKIMRDMKINGRINSKARTWAGLKLIVIL
ncbi:MAG: hypothetical protein GX638_17975 [Crenarchaeota archaeon]|nr:hypothetical protein [Thermoproteota archaeon]